MFQQFYGFTRLPFSKSIPTDDLFNTAGQNELSARLTYLVREQGLGLITGEFGSGKSTAVRAFTASLDFNRYFVIYLTNPTTGISGLYREMLFALGHEPPYTASQQVSAIRVAFDDLLSHKRRASLVIVDEAHLLTQDMLEQLRLLFSYKMDSQSLATLVLVGHPSLRSTLRLTIHEAFYQRLAVRYHLPPLDLQETLGYVKHHVQVAGFTSTTLFTDDAITRIFEYTKGTCPVRQVQGLPRRINQVCTTALMAAMIDQKSIVEESSVRKALYLSYRTSAIADLEYV
ncbi:MAG: AAA family ATPase [Chloroflexi bacterium]|nr:AAA family ATPase [Chloroflexota bacterium]